MNDEETKPGEHYVCYGGCKGVSDKPGTCQAPDCSLSGHALEKCDCTDGKHSDPAPKEE